MLGKFSGTNLSAELQKFLAADKRISETMAVRGFTGELGEHCSIALGEKSLQGRVLFVGLGKSGSFDCGTVRSTTKLGVNRALAHRCERLTIPIFPNRLTSGNLGLLPNAYIIKCVAEDVLAGKKGDGTLEIELLCTPHARRHVEAGLAKQRRSTGNVCGEVKTRKQVCTDGCK